MSAGLAGWPEDMIQLGADLRAGRFIADPPWVLVATPTLADPGRAPAGQHTVKILSPQIYQLPAAWAAGTPSRNSTPGASWSGCAGPRRTSPTR